MHTKHYQPLTCCFFLLLYILPAVCALVFSTIEAGFIIFFFFPYLHFMMSGEKVENNSHFTRRPY